MGAIVTDWESFMDDLAKEAQAEGPEAVAEMEAMRAHYRNECLQLQLVEETE